MDDYYVTFDCSSSTTTDGVWISWVNDATNTGSSWVTDSTTTSSPWITWTIQAVDLAASRARATKLRLEKERKARQPREKARTLLRSLLTEEEWQSWREHNSVRLLGSEGGLYEIGCGWAGMLYKLDPATSEPLAKLCCHPPSHFPVEDRVATLVLALRADENDVLHRANVHHFSDEEKRRVRARRAHRLAS